MAEVDHLGFYTKHEISPVRQNIADIEKHCQRRESLYRQLGILPATIKGKSVLEVGPGSGYNSVYTAMLDPAHYLLLEGNPTGIGQIEKLFAEFPELASRVTMQLGRIEQFATDKRFDFVFCEGVLSGVFNPEEILNRLTSVLSPDGVLVVTCVDHISHFSETLRRLAAQLLTDSQRTPQQQAEQLLPMFTAHLDSLAGMSRRYDDWIIDNLIHPGSIIDNISIPEILDKFATQLDYYAASPHFVTDWRWYKQITGEQRSQNRIATEQYWRNAHNFLDYRRLLPTQEVESGQQLYALCTDVRHLIGKYEEQQNTATLNEVGAALEKMVSFLGGISTELQADFGEFLDWLQADQPDPEAFAKLVGFGPLFGRGQQYISLTRKR